MLVGEVDDENTFAAGGVLGQAGLFGNARVLLTFAREMIDARKGEGQVFDKEMALKFTTKFRPDSDNSFGLGFDGKSASGSLLPENFGPNSFGHWGFYRHGIMG
ncbi:MAG: hypothetical protein M5R36_21055 [Deltaproteobacteria bacterium]|nr:hypothetical protein [Deltaproteobacteria bacterium]